MNKTYLIGGGVVVAILIIAGLMMTGKAVDVSTPTDGVNNERNEEMSTKMSMKHSLKDFLSMGDASRCTYKNEDATAITEGTTFVHNGKVRSDSRITLKKTNAVTTSFSIIADGVMYAWGSDMPTGMKMELATMEDMKDDTSVDSDTTKETQTQTQTQDYETAYDYECDGWSADGSVFVPPSDVTFTDYSAMMKQMMGVNGMGSDSMMFDSSGTMEAGAGGGGGDASMCAICDQAPNKEAKTQCLIAMGCQ